MAGLFSHLIAGKSTSLMLDIDHRRIISENKEAYYLGTQGPDLFFYYYTRILYKSMRPLGQMLHKERVGKFLSELLYHTKHIKNQKQQEVAIAYLLGYMSHYVVDAYTHPYVYFNAGFSTRKKFKLSPLNSYYHRVIEDNIDKVLLNYYYFNASEHHKEIGIDIEHPKKTRQIRHYFKMPKENIGVIATLLKTAIHHSYDINIDSSRVNAAINQMILTLTVLETNPTIGRKLSILEDNTQFSEIDIEKIKIFQDVQCTEDYFNFEHRTWHAPWDLSIKSTHSFFDLLSSAINESTDIFNDVLNYIDGKISFNDVMDVIQNRSLAHGADCVENIAFKYHNVIFKKTKDL